MAQSTRDGRERDKREKAKSGTISQKKHRFASFTQRIECLDINPIRKRQQLDTAIQHSDVQDSYFVDALQRWRDVNLGSSFTDFQIKIPSCSTLAQVLHFAPRIFTSLREHIASADVHSLEPLLDLLSQLAHDLGTAFDVVEAVRCVITLDQSDIAVIEWSFNCLAWLFKYFSRHLISDGLSPLYEIMAPNLGRQTRKPYIARFTAEALSFLVRKAASHNSLQNIMNAIQNDVANHQRQASNHMIANDYKTGLSMLMLNGIIGVDHQLHSKGLSIYKCLFETAKTADNSSIGLVDVLYSTTIALVHRTNADGLAPILNFVLASIENVELAPSSRGHDISERVLFLLCATRKGSRITSWSKISHACLQLLKRSSSLSNRLLVPDSLKVVMVVVQSAPPPVPLQYLHSIMETILAWENDQIFMIFCKYFHKMGRDRFSEFAARYFSDFMTRKWQTHRFEILQLLPELYSASMKKQLSCPSGWEEHILEIFGNHEIIEQNMPECYQTLVAAQTLSFSERFEEQLVASLEANIGAALRGIAKDSCRTFLLGPGLEFFASLPSFSSLEARKFWPDLCRQSTHLGSVPSYLRALSLVAQTLGNDMNDIETKILEARLVENLHAKSSDLRKLSLGVLSQLAGLQGSSYETAIQVMIQIEALPKSFEQARRASMFIRRLPLTYRRLGTNSAAKRAVSHFCFGVFTYKLASAREDVISVLKEISEDEEGFHLISNMVFDWLEVGFGPQEEPTQNGAVESRMSILGHNEKEFNCSNVCSLDSMAEEVISEITKTQDIISTNLLSSLRSLPIQSADSSAHALDLLVGFASLAEQESTRFVPHFLSWASTTLRLVGEESHDSETASKGVQNHSYWSLAARKATLKILAQFQQPQHIFQADEVFMALEDLLCHGDVDVQTLALKAIFAWRKPELIPYHDNLLNILDDARMRDELTNFLHFDQLDQGVPSDHQQMLTSITLKLLYGKMIAKEGRSAGKSGQDSRRKAILHALCRFRDDSIGQFVDVALGQFRCVELVNSAGLNQKALGKVEIAHRQQIGMLKLVKALLEVLGPRLETHIQQLIKAPLFTLSTISERSVDELSETIEASPRRIYVSQAKNLRSLSFSCLSLMAKKIRPQAMSLYVGPIFSEALSPRLEKLALETSQAVSGILRLFSAWAASPLGVHFLVDYDRRALTSPVDCLTEVSCKQEVKLFVMKDILSPLLSSVSSLKNESNDAIAQSPSQATARKVLELISERTLLNLHHLLKATSNKDLLDAGIGLLEKLALEVEQTSQALAIVNVSVALLRKPSNTVSPRLKGHVLRILSRFLPAAKASMDTHSNRQVFEVLSGLFGYFKDRENRIELAETLLVFANENLELKEVSGLCYDLNAYSTKKAGEPDFERRVKAFNTINSQLCQNLSATQWMPILENVLYYMQDEDEMVLRANSILTFKKFIDAVALARETKQDDLSPLLDINFLVKMRRGAHHPSELIRSEYISLFAYLIQKDSLCSRVRDLQPLLVGNDEEASFFTNILHIQQHRRIRAVRRLAQYAESSILTTANVSLFLIPLLEHFIFDSSEDQVASSLAQESIVAIGILARSLEWSQYRATFGRYCTYLDKKPDHVKSVMRLLGVLADTLRVACSKGLGNDEGNLIADVQDQSSVLSLSETLPEKGALSLELRRHILPKMIHFIHHKDENVVSLRAPVSIVVVKIFNLLPVADMQQSLPPLLTDLCNILRSRAQDSRDLARKTLREISTLIGPQYFGFLLQELRTALARGSQLHVLSFTIHSILVDLSQVIQVGDLDPYLAQITSIAMEDLIGKVGHEKDAAEYVSKMREVKSCKAYDTMEIISSLCSLSQVVHILRPIKLSFDSKLDLQTVRKLDELLRRLELGLARNVQAVDQRIMIFTYELLKTASSSSHQTSPPSNPTPHRQYSVTKPKHEIPIIMNTPSPIYNQKMVKFALSLLRAVLRKNKHLKTSANLSGWVPLLGEALMTEEEIQIPALRLLLDIIDLPIQAFEQNAGIYIAECVKLIKNAASTDVEVSQAAYKLVAGLLRHKSSTEVREGDVAYLLKKLVPELEQPDKQGGAFNFVKAVMSCKIVIPEVYEIHDEIARIMVTNHTKSARDAARASFTYFILNYPQTRERYSKQISFLVHNLDYKYVEGRQSVMETLHVVYTKAPYEFSHMAIQQSYISLMMLMINDESAQCREMSGALLRTLFEKADSDIRKDILAMLRKWLEPSGNSLMRRAALQVFPLIIDTSSEQMNEQVKFIKPKLLSILHVSNADPSNADWELFFYALQIISKLCEKFSEEVLNRSQSELWAELCKCLTFPHSWVKLSACKLLGTLYSEIAKSDRGNGLISLPLSSSYGLELDEPSIIETAETFVGLLGSEHSSADLADQCARNLLFLGNTMRRARISFESESDENGEVRFLDTAHSSDLEELAKSLPVEHLGKKPTAFITLIVRLSRILREPPATKDRQSLQPLKSSLKLLGAFVTRMDSTTLRECSVSILIPLHSLTDSAIPRPFSTDPGFTEDYELIQANALELMSKLQEKLGTTDYVDLVHQVRDRAKQKREERRTKRAIDRVAHPERAGRNKKKKNDKKREKRKEKQSGFRATRRGW